MLSSQAVCHLSPAGQCPHFSSDCITGVDFADDGSQVLANYLGESPCLVCMMFGPLTNRLGVFISAMGYGRCSACGLPSDCFSQLTSLLQLATLQDSPNDPHNPFVIHTLSRVQVMNK
jgi:hypothetical protein